MNFINLTPHSIVVVGGPTIAPSGQVARCAATTEVVGEANGVILTATCYGAVEGLPAPVEGVIYIVSALVRTACPERSEVASPGELVRNAEGQVIGCKNLVVNR